MRKLLGGKGAGLAEMTNARAPGAARLHDHDRGLQRLLRGGQAAPRRPVGRRSLAAHARRSSTRPARSFGDPANPLLVSVRSGAAFSMPGMMDTVLNLGLNAETVAGPDRSRPATTASPTTRYRRFIAHVRPDRARHPGRPRSSTSRRRAEGRPWREARHRPRPPTTCNELAARYKEIVQRADRQATSRPIRTSSSGWRSGPCSTAGTASGRIDYREFNKIPHDLGHGGQRRDDGVRQHGQRLRHRRRLHPRPEHRRKALYGEYLTNAQGEDVVAGIRTPAKISQMQRRAAGGLRASSRRSARSSSRTTATSRTWSSRSSGARSTCSRPAPRSAPPRPR